MLKVTDTKITSVAQQATDGLGVVAMVNMEIASAFRVIRSAASALAILGSKSFFVPSKRNAVATSKDMILCSPRIFFTPLTTFLRSFLQVFLSPNFMALEGASAAINRPTVQGMTTFAKFCDRLCFFAARTVFGGRIVKGFLRHECVLQLNTRSSQ